MQSEDPVIRVRDLVVGFGDTVVLNRVSLDVFRGEILGLVGGSGSGKSVFLRTIIGLLPKREGSIEILGANVDGLNFEERRAIERRCGVLFQHGALFSSLTVLENVQFPMREYLNISKGFMDDVARAKLDMVGLGARDAEKYPSELSGGMTKRAALARALALDPEIVFLDEPTGGVDPVTRRQFWDMIYEAAASGITIFVSTHYMDEAEYCNRITVMVDGKIEALDSPRNLKEQFSVDTVEEVFYRLARKAKRVEN